MTTRVRWVVGPKDGVLLGPVVVKAHGDADAIADGRVFIGRRRAGSADDTVRPGDEVFVSKKPSEPLGVKLLLHADGLVVADKPAGIVTIPDHGDAASSLRAVVARSLQLEATSLHATSRLDRGVSGVVVFAGTEAAAERLRSAREQGRYERRYVAIASRAPSTTHGEWTAAIGRGADPRHRSVDGRGAAPSLSRYGVVALAGDWALLALEPVTGRTHQLRVHAANAGAPLLGDRVYGGLARATLPSGRVLAFPRIALHAARVRVPREDGTLLEIAAPVPDELRAWWRAAGGVDAAWEDALAWVMGAATPG